MAMKRYLPVTRRQMLKTSLGLLAIFATPTISRTEDVPTSSTTPPGITYDPSGYPENLTLHTNVALIRDPSRLLLSFKKPYSDQGIGQIRPLGLVPENFYDAAHSTCAGLLKPGEELNQSPVSLWLRSRDCSPIPSLSEEQIESAFMAPLEWIGPVYWVVSIKQKGRRALLCPRPDVLLVKPTKNVDEATLFTKMASLGLSEVPTKSKHLRPYRYYLLKNPRQQKVYPLRDLLLRSENLIDDAYLSGRQMLKANAAVPTDQYWESGDQWNMERIGASLAWASPMFSANKPQRVAVWIIDEGVDLGLPGNPRPLPDPHADLAIDPSYGRNMFDVTDPDIDGRCGLYSAHGTLMAGIIGAKFDNDVDPTTKQAMGVAGLTPNRCEIVPLTWSPNHDYENELPRAINFALDEGARFINVSQQFEDAIITPALYDASTNTGALVNAATKGALLCFATGNSGTSWLTGPAKLFQFVVPCGASIKGTTPGVDEDQRWQDSSQEGSMYGEGLSVVAPGKDVFTTTHCDPTKEVRGCYAPTTGTSIATAHVSALAGYLFSQYPTLSGAQIRNIIEQTADKVLPARYTYDEKTDTWPDGTYKYPNGPWNNQVGYGRIHVFNALDYADVMIRDCVSDTGIQPSKPPCTAFWNSPDIIVLPDDLTPTDDLFLGAPRTVFTGKDNYVYVRVTNNGPNDARNVEVNVHIAPYIGSEFIYPDDWTSASTIVPTRMTPSSVVIPAMTGVNSHIAKFRIEASQVGTLALWHPCILAEVVAQNDYAFENAKLLPGKVNVSQRNNLAQRNLTVATFRLIEGTSKMRLPFIAGNRLNVDEELEVAITLDWDPTKFPVRLYLDEDLESFSRDGGMLPQFLPSIGPAMRRLHFSDRQGIQVEGGILTHQQDRTFLTLTNQNLRLKAVKEPRRLYPFALETTFTSRREIATPFTVHIAQKTTAGTVVGGATIIYVPENPR